MPDVEAAPAPMRPLQDEELIQAYRVGVRSRALEEYIVRLVNKGEVKFAIWGPGEEVHGAATALALSRVVTPSNFGLIPHYRSGALCSMWSELNGMKDFSLTVLRQQFSKDTDPISRGRQMVYHLYLPEVGILPVQSPVGMQLGKAAGYAMGYRFKGITDGIAMGVIGDGTSAEGDLHDAMNAASVWQLPVIILITDNGIAISTTPDEGRGIKDFKSYAEGFGVRHVECDGRDFFDVYEKTLDAARYVSGEQKPVLLHARHLPRFNGHSSAADVTFDLSQDDPLIAFGEELVRRGILGDDDILRRKEGTGRDFFSHHRPGRVMDEEIENVRQWIEKVRGEPEPDPATIEENIYPPFPAVSEPETSGETNVTYAGAIRAAIDNICAKKNGVLWGEDVGRLGGVMTATAGLKDRHPDRIIDTPLNEPLIVGTACGASMHDDLVLLPEVQFGDYTLNAFHWFVHMGNVYWATNGGITYNVILRTPVDPFGGGAMYHSMSLDGYLSPIPGLVILMPSTSFDAYGLLLTAADYDGPVIVLEPKWTYRLALGPAIPGEPTDPEEINLLKKAVMRGDVPTLDPNVRVPFSKAVTRRSGEDVTIVAWGRAVWTAMEAAASLDDEGVSAEVIDLRTLVPPDLDAVYESVARTGRLLVASEDRPFAGFVRTIQGHAVERFPGLPSRALGQKNVPGIAQSHRLESATILNANQIVEAAHEVMEETAGGPSGFCWIPSRFHRF